MLQSLLLAATAGAQSAASAKDVLCRLELWSVCLTRLSQLEEAAYDAPDPEAALEKWQASVTAYAPLAETLLRYMLTVTT